MKEMFDNMQNGGCKKCGCSSDSSGTGTIGSNQPAASGWEGNGMPTPPTGSAGTQMPGGSGNTGGLGNLADCNQVLIETIGLARAYVPFQTTLDIMPEGKGLACGTIFADLSMPYKKGTGLANS